MGRKTAKERLPLPEAKFTRESSEGMNFQDRAPISGKTGKLIVAVGSVTRCTGRGLFSGLTGKCTQAISRMIRERARESLPGRMGGSMTVSGKMGSRMGRGSSSTRRER